MTSPAKTIFQICYNARPNSGINCVWFVMAILQKVSYIDYHTDERGKNTKPALKYRQALVKPADNMTVATKKSFQHFQIKQMSLVNIKLQIYLTKYRLMNATKSIISSLNRSMFNVLFSKCTSTEEKAAFDRAEVH